MRDNRIDFKPNKLVHKFGGPFDLPVFPPIFDLNSRTLNPAEIVQTLNKCVGPCLGSGVAIRTQKAEDRDFRPLLRAHCERPSRRSTEQQYEITALHGFLKLKD